MNEAYGNSENLKIYSKNNKSIKASIEHGLYIGNHYNKFETSNSFLPAIITLSEYRKKILLNKNKFIFDIGPYIHYSKKINMNFIQKEKEKYGKNLLVFPSHSIESIEWRYNIKDFINLIKKIKKAYNFDTVNICLYWVDINNKLDEVYKKEDFNVITAGHKKNKYFLNNLKKYILLSDFVISNNIGTHIGYVNYLNRPQYIYKQELKVIANSEKDYKKEFGDRDFESTEKIKNKLYKAFSKINFEITREQKEICNYYWGFDKVKTPDEINFILTFLDEAFYLMNKKKYTLKEIYNKKIYDIKNDNYKRILKESFNGGLDDAEQ
ncbi:hypothetical protein [Oceanotoga sp.]|uniref:hypothetical protein n=1 Tax=Oceanotoga sp. TaxID=2108366 RepID=UPI0028060745|nr:hypothetical protein [Oceanotoga sp.]